MGRVRKTWQAVASRAPYAAAQHVYTNGVLTGMVATARIQLMVSEENSEGGRLVEFRMEPDQASTLAAELIWAAQEAREKNAEHQGHGRV